MLGGQNFTFILPTRIAAAVIDFNTTIMVFNDILIIHIIVIGILLYHDATGRRIVNVIGEAVLN